MKQCISKLIAKINTLWQTLKEYVCKRKCPKVDIDPRDIKIDLNGDGTDDISLHDYSHLCCELEQNDAERKKYK